MKETYGFSALLSIEAFRRYVPSKDYTEQLVVQLSTFCNMQKVIADMTQIIADMTQIFQLKEKQVAQDGNLFQQQCDTADGVFLECLAALEPLKNRL